MERSISAIQKVTVQPGYKYMSNITQITFLCIYSRSILSRSSQVSPDYSWTFFANFVQIVNVTFLKFCCFFAGHGCFSFFDVLCNSLRSRVSKPSLPENHISCRTKVRGPDILRNVIVSRYFTFYQINKLSQIYQQAFVNILCFIIQKMFLLAAFGRQAIVWRPWFRCMNETSVKET